MNHDKKIERLYVKWERMSDDADNELKQKKADRLFNKLVKMFPDKQSV
jgi:hypothetical protein